MSKDTVAMEKFEQVDELIHKAINELNKVTYNYCLRRAKRLIFEAYFSETDS